jgi:hypothetical protein
MYYSGSSEENSLTDIINPYMRELKMHPKESRDFSYLIKTTKV